MEATYYEEHKDDPDLWGEPVVVATRQRDELTATITVHFSVEEAADIRRFAMESGLSYSEVVRQAVQRFTRSRAVAGAASACPPSPATDASTGNQADSKDVRSEHQESESARSRTR
jgi:hypothetical protein